MKILHLIYTEGVAGAEKYLVNLLPGLKQYDIECELICVCPKSSASVLTQYCKMMNDKGIKTLLLTGSKINFFHIAKSINKYLKEENISIIHSHLFNADLIAVILKIFYNKKIFIISSKHGYDERYLIKYSPEANPHIIDRNLYYSFTKLLLNKINVNLGISKAISNLYFNIKLARRHYHYIHHGISIIQADNNVEEKFQNQILIIGRLEEVKGHRYLLDAMPEVLKHLPDTKLLIVGDGSEKHTLQEQAKAIGISRKVFFMGFQPNPYRYMQQSAVIVLPSLFESFGLVYIESFFLKIPVIAFDAPAANEIITNNETGILVPKFDYKTLAQKIIYLLQNPEERYRISENAYQIFLQNYTKDKMVAETAKWYKSINLPA